MERKEKFTPGPWKVCHVRDLNMFAVIQVSTKNVIGNFIERRDARLIAAAPEMYAALKDLMSAMDDVLYNADRVPDCIVAVAQNEMDKAKAALKKARGEA